METAVTIGIPNLQLFILMGAISPTWNAVSLLHPWLHAIHRVFLRLGPHARAENHAVEFRRSSTGSSGMRYSQWASYPGYD